MMKQTFTAFVGALALLAVSSVNATAYTETYEYSGAGEYNSDSVLSSGESLNFGFDMNAVGGLGSTPSSFTLTEDAVGAAISAPWQAGWLEIDLYSIDTETEKTTIDVTAWNGSLDQILLDTFVWDGTTGDFNITYNFTSADLDVFDDWGWSNVFIAATSNGPFPVDNDFAVKKVSITVVPEPSIIALFGLGLIGMGFIGRRKKS